MRKTGCMTEKKNEKDKKAGLVKPKTSMKACGLLEDHI